jgi:hypothetical protein
MITDPPIIDGRIDGAVAVARLVVVGVLPISRRDVTICKVCVPHEAAANTVIRVGIDSAKPTTSRTGDWAF